MAERTKFEGEPVDGYELMFRQYRGAIDIPLAHGEIVHLKVTAKVKSVDHRENERTGLFRRHHEVSIVDMVLEEDK